ncbi:MAG: DMT family transporter [Candidatus Pacebacteria bacterium]|nr:DMT family transporter [Candidatus Paceibacterota bacterium]
MLGIIFGLISMICFGLSNAISQGPSQKIGSIRSTYWRGLFMVLLLFPVFLFNVNSAVFLAEYILIALGIAVVGYFPLLSFFKALDLGKIGVVSPIANSSIIITVLFSIFFYGEKPSMMRLISIGIILLGIILITIDLKDIRNSRLFKKETGIFFAFVSMFLWGIVSALYKIPVTVIGPVLTSLVVEVGILACSTVSMLRKKKSFDLPDRSILTQVFLIAVFGSIAILSYNFGIERYNINLVASLVSASPLVATLYGKYVYNEEVTFIQWIAIFVIIAGIILLSVFH